MFVHEFVNKVFRIQLENEAETSENSKNYRLKRIMLKSNVKAGEFVVFCVVGVFALPLMLFVILFVCLILIWINFMSSCRCCSRVDSIGLWLLTTHIVKFGSLWLQWIMSSFIWAIQQHKYMKYLSSSQNGEEREIEFEKNARLFGLMLHRRLTRVWAFDDVSADSHV